ncbi:hypothetical protein [Leifsonia sp. 1010]|uniref:hypothetical protein n=1 Tax=Leifsonia sp. 1010 TaxID=2817769 RepID=UPI002864B104|nr:hypothetical protein [Leifsonia sp. 1010]MDR6612608.1 hypothetical protein [Leifsonia sp. 1010]
MDDRSAGRHAFHADAATNVEETPQLTEGRRKVRNGWLILAVAAAALLWGLLADVLNLAPLHSALHPLVTVAIVSGGVFTVHGIRTIRNGRAALRTEIKRQAEAPGTGRAVGDS